MDEEICWKAIKNNDYRFNGAFVYGVISTKIYCKPSCPSRRPKRGNVRFFKANDQAESSGFRACKRCLPKSEKPNAQTETVLKICGILESGEAVTLAEIGKQINLSPSYLQKLFKDIVGISPAKYAKLKRLENFKAELKGGRDVANAIYESGFGSSSRLYEGVSENLGMTPAVYKKKGKGMKIEFAITDCILGKLLVARTEKGICAVTFGDDPDILRHDLVNEFSAAEITESNSGLNEFVHQILAHLDGTNKSLDLPLDLQATAFQMRVWDALRKIPYGSTASYQDIAERLGNTKAVRAVATACASNKVALVIPCHRVVRSNGEISGYRWGVERKRQILDLEKSLSSRQ